MFTEYDIQIDIWRWSDIIVLHLVHREEEALNSLMDNQQLFSCIPSVRTIIDRSVYVKGWFLFFSALRVRHVTTVAIRCKDVIVLLVATEGDE